MKLENKICIVTGGGSGIGASICRAFAHEGAKVVVADVDAAAAERTAADIRSSGREAIATTMNVSKADSVTSSVSAVHSSFGGIDVLVNNAGARIIKGFMQHSIDDWNAMLQINLTGPFLCSQAVVPSMIERGGGKIINLVSIASFMGRPNRCAYVAAKTGLLGLTRAMATDLSPKNIRVNAIAPGMIASPFNQSFSEAGDTGPAWAEENLRGRWGQPDDIAGAAVFLASDDSDFVNGSEIKVEGGWLNARSRSGELPIWD
jgi:NAD(P)-dependent dehydrogenase (short-subunit alcohol dehydrogenase family)